MAPPGSEPVAPPGQPGAAARFRVVTSDEDVAAAVAESWHRPVLLFKHSATCGVSAMAHEELTAMAADPAAPPIYLIDVRASRAVSNAVATRFSLRHESPQVLIVDRGQLLWSASHFGVTADRVRRAAQAPGAAGTAASA